MERKHCDWQELVIKSNIREVVSKTENVKLIYDGGDQLDRFIGSISD